MLGEAATRSAPVEASARTNRPPQYLRLRCQPSCTYQLRRTKAALLQGRALLWSCARETYVWRTDVTRVRWGCFCDAARRAAARLSQHTATICASYARQPMPHQLTPLRADVVPAALRQTHTLPSAPSAHAFDALFESYRSGLESFSVSASQGIDSLIALLHGEDTSAHEPSVEPLRFDAHLDELRASYGADSSAFAEAKASVSAALESLVAGAKAHAPNLAVVVLPRREASSGLEARDSLDVFSTAPRASRAVSDVEADPLLAKRPKESDYIGKCFKSAKDLEKATAECSGHGKAVQTNHGARKCYTCQCKASKHKGRTTYWAGEACQKVDVSGPFVLIASTVVVLLLVTLGSVYYLMAEGSAELPSVLTGLSKTSN
ncbi:hypothetical protein FA09DRAFT_54227 [Tilletiopsis washingtonensis]|uniref:Vacuolar sorting protein Vps3844 C-terminal domain-containing protein n=1 Tax=Tilletiopsis washingtonensis TaxID=58919 RepID=A0A316Z8X5_9BASI|nr:hypothetical protein FA09DRAFT_54227 [Tilletiopsis washingtonensis]PWN97438.1 hypothetical protein FA09DRAFT_54227 [Tilletiopsis washingtonensis]